MISKLEQNKIRYAVACINELYVRLSEENFKFGTFLVLGGIRMKKINVKFSGYKWDNYPFPNVNGLYGIYTTKKNFKGENIVGDLVYVGISNNIDRRIKEHASKDFPSKDKYCYIYSELSEADSKLAEAAIVSECKPERNSEYINGYPEDFERVQLKISGKHKNIPETITIM